MGLGWLLKAKRGLGAHLLCNLTSWNSLAL